MEAVAYVTRYIHANSLDEGVAPEDYVWSSAGIYLGIHECPEWMEVKPVLDQLGGADRYAEYLRAAPKKPKRDVEREAAQDAFLTYLEEKVTRLLQAKKLGLGQKAFTPLICVVASRNYAMRPRVLARHFGYSSGACVSALVSRMIKRLEASPGLDEVLRRC
jgi:hypothetical protein